MKSLNKEIVFDGSKFWLENEVIGEVDVEMKFKDNYEKEFLDEQKQLCLGKIIGGVV